MRSPLRLLAPMFLIASGVVFLLDQAGAFGLGWILSLFWPGLLVCFGMESLNAPGRGVRRWGGALVAAGIVLWADNFGLLHLELERFWPLALIAVGVCLVVGRET